MSGSGEKWNVGFLIALALNLLFWVVLVAVLWWLL